MQSLLDWIQQGQGRDLLVPQFIIQHGVRTYNKCWMNQYRISLWSIENLFLLNKGHFKSEFNLVVCGVKIFRAFIFSVIYPYQISKLDLSRYAHIRVCVYMYIRIYLHERGRKRDQRLWLLNVWDNTLHGGLHSAHGSSVLLQVGLFVW